VAVSPGASDVWGDGTTAEAPQAVKIEAASPARIRRKDVRIVDEVRARPGNGATG
jgi:hypothetical protein